MASRPHGFLGWAAVKKTAGQSLPAVGTQTAFPVTEVEPRNPYNVHYPRVVNAAAAPSVLVTGKRTPSIGLKGIPLKQSWFTYPFLNSLIALLDSNNNTDEFGIGVNNGNSTRVYDGAKCSELVLHQDAREGVAFMDAQFSCRFGDSEAGTPTSFTTPSADAGTAYQLTDVTFTGTAVDVDAWRLALMRPQGHVNTCDGTLYSDVLQSGPLGGVLSLWQNPLAATVPTTSVTLRIGAAGTGVQIVCNLNLDDRYEAVQPATGAVLRSYTLINSANGAAPVQFSTY